MKLHLNSIDENSMYYVSMKDGFSMNVQKKRPRSVKKLNKYWFYLLQGFQYIMVLLGFKKRYLFISKDCYMIPFHLHVHLVQHDELNRNNLLSCI